ncbi:MAG: ribosome biogenesis GTPase Der [Acidimicrobiales bacterium]
MTEPASPHVPGFNPRPVQVPRTLPLVVIVGRPNVGKSTLVNRVVGRRIAVTEEKPGVTRDRLELETEWAGRSFLIVDTGGWIEKGESLDVKVTAQSEKAIALADVVVFVVDSTVGITTEDEAFARKLRRIADKVIVVANKVDSDRREIEAWTFVALGLGDPFMVSALHGRGSGDLLDEVVARLPALEEEVVIDETPVASDWVPSDGLSSDEEPDSEDDLDEDDDLPIADAVTAVAIIGRPNVGKSTLFNRLIGEDRAVVHDMPGTTRDAIDTMVETSEGTIRFVDTAGMRRRSHNEDGTEYFAMVRALRALDQADVALLVIDSTEGVSHQDQRLAERIAASGSPVVVLLNKWDQVSRDEREQVTFDVGDRLSFLGETPVLKVSALTGLGVHRILGALGAVVEAYHLRIPTGELNRAMKAIQSAHPAPGSRIRYAVQGATDPPTITLFASRRLPATYLRYLERSLRERFDIGPTPIKIRVQVGN